LLVEHGQTHTAPLVRLMSLFHALEGSAVRYCVWKSNSHLDAALEGATDVDILVHRADANEFRRLVAACGAKALVAPPAEANPAMEHYLGFDDVSARQFHLHVHYELVLGRKHVKNHRLPIEPTLLATTRRLLDVRVPSAELELAILAARVLLKYRARDVVKDVLSIRSPGVPEELRLELAWLYGQTSVHELRASLRRAGVIPASVVEALVRCLGASSRDGVSLVRLRAKLRRALRPYERHGRVSAHVRYVRGLLRRRRRFRRPTADLRLTPATGGRTIAVIGADGSGKSTTVSALEPWLGWKLQTSSAYLGSKQPSRRSTALYLVFRLLRRTHREASRARSRQAALVGGVAVARDVVFSLHFLSIARDRTRRIARGHRRARAGQVVVFDRYPVRPLSRALRDQIYDGSHITLTLRSDNRCVRALARVEDRLYAACPLPDQLVVLDVDAAVAAARKPDHDADIIAAKADIARELVQRAEHAGIDVERVDANQDFELVLAHVKRAVWRGL
jgi:thymidylate kinase